jgi:predicted NUDIX family NTP pyrophosphohydrolase
MKRSAGLLMYKYNEDYLEVLLGHMGGPFWVNKDKGAWSIIKGEYGEDEDPFLAAKREFVEETGLEPSGDFKELKEIKQPSGKHIKIWAFKGDFNPENLKCNTFELEWPPKSGIFQNFPEIDRVAWLPTNIAKEKILKGQIGFIDDLCALLNYDSSIENIISNDNNKSEGLIMNNGEQLSLFD